MEYIYGVIQEDMKEIGYRINYMAGVSINGHKVENTKVSINMIKNMDLVVIHGQMVENI
jgi:hypothetical protein